MIVISGALVLVALVLLVIGIVGQALAFVYASIGVSLVSLVFLVVGILQRRDEPLPDAQEPLAHEPAAFGPDRMGGGRPQAPGPQVSAAAAPGQVATEDPDADGEADDSGGGPVLVVGGRPRYHLAGCRYLVGRDATQVSVRQARDQGFTPCGFCKPDAAPPGQASRLTGADQPAGADQPTGADETAGADQPTRADRPLRSGQPRTEDIVAAGGPARRPVTARRVVADGRAVGDGAPAGRSARKAPAEPVAGTADVVAIPDRGRFHRTECRYVRGVGGAQTMQKDAAAGQGYVACGVCRP